MAVAKKRVRRKATAKRPARRKTTVRKRATTTRKKPVSSRKSTVTKRRSTKVATKRKTTARRTVRRARTAARKTTRRVTRRARNYANSGALKADFKDINKKLLTPAALGAVGALATDFAWGKATFIPASMRVGNLKHLSKAALTVGAGFVVNKYAPAKHRAKVNQAITGALAVQAYGLGQQILAKTAPSLLGDMYELDSLAELSALDGHYMVVDDSEPYGLENLDADLEIDADGDLLDGLGSDLEVDADGDFLDSLDGVGFYEDELEAEMLP